MADLNGPRPLGSALRPSHFSRARASVGWRRVSKSRARWAAPPGGGCYRPASHGPVPTEESRRVPPLGVGWGPVPPIGGRLRWTACSAPRPPSVAGAVTSHDVPRTLAMKWPPSTRLETRTKESNICASSWVVKPVGAMKVTAGIFAPATD